jgi:hypothetical protein
MTLKCFGKRVQRGPVLAHGMRQKCNRPSPKWTHVTPAGILRIILIISLHGVCLTRQLSPLGTKVGLPICIARCSMASLSVWPGFTVMGSHRIRRLNCDRGLSSGKIRIQKTQLRRLVTKIERSLRGGRTFVVTARSTRQGVIRPSARERYHRRYTSFVRPSR